MKFKKKIFSSTEILVFTVGVKYEHSMDSLDDDDGSRYILTLVLLCVELGASAHR